MELDGLENRRLRLFLAVLVAVYLIYSALFIWRTSFVIDGERIFCLFDDAMISMVYAKNLAGGQGLVWNPGEPPVEGFTNPLWVAYMAVWHLLPIPPAKISLVVQCTNVVIVIASLLLAARIAGRMGGGNWPVIAAPTLAAFTYGQTMWAMGGMETAAATLIILALVDEATKPPDRGPLRRRSFFLVAAGVLLRMDMAVALLSILAVYGFHHWRSGRRRHAFQALRVAGVMIVSLGALVSARYAYFGDLMPNTYYLKVTGYPVAVRIARGLWTFHLFAIDYLYVPVLGVILGFILLRRSMVGRILLVVFVVQCLYAVWVGGDAWKTYPSKVRFIAVAMPLFFIVLTSLMAKRLPGRMHRGPGGVVLLALLIVLFNAADWREALLLESSDRREYNIRRVQIARTAREILGPGGVIAVTAAGVVPYFSGLRAIDLLGKCDRDIARSDPDLPESVRSLHIGHHKSDIEQVLLDRQPDAVMVSSYRRVLNVLEQEPLLSQIQVGRFRIGMPVGEPSGMPEYAFVDDYLGPPFLLIRKRKVVEYSQSLEGAG